jgi:hypothetical protein
LLVFGPLGNWTHPAPSIMSAKTTDEGGLPDVLLVTHHPCVDGDAAREVIRMALGDTVSLTEVGVDHRSNKETACATIVDWIRAHSAEGSLALFFDVSPPQLVREELLSQWAAGSQLRVHVGDHHASELQGMVAFSKAAAAACLDAAAFTMDWGPEGAVVSGVTLAHWWAHARGSGPVGALNPRVLHDIAFKDTTGLSLPFARFIDSPRAAEWTTRAVLTCTPDLYQAFVAIGEDLQRSLEKDLAPLLSAVRKLDPASCYVHPECARGGGVYLVVHEDARKASAAADLVWRHTGPTTAALFLMRTGPSSLSLRHAPNSTVTALQGAQWLGDLFGALAPAGGLVGAAGVTLPVSTLDSMFAADSTPAFL